MGAMLLLAMMRSWMIPDEMMVSTERSRLFVTSRLSSGVAPFRNTNAEDMRGVSTSAERGERERERDGEREREREKERERESKGEKGRERRREKESM